MSDARIGSEIAGFRIVSVLGQGGMGTVYVAEQASPRRKVVLKLLRPDLSEDDAFRRRFIHESEAAASTEHPNIVPIYSSGEADGVLYIAMRYVEGEDLRQRLAREGRLPADRAVEIVSQVASALDAAHRRGLVHRDVKPGNILLDEHGNAYLSDFGLIKRTQVGTDLTKTGQFMGSIEYCAPEQIRGDEVDGRADVYSLACVLYECIAGRPPFKRDTEVATLYAHLEQDPPRLAPDGSGPLRELDRAVTTAMAKRPSERYASAGEFARAARHAVGATSGQRAAAAPPGPRRRILLAVGGVALVLAAVGLALARSSDGDGAQATGPAVTGSLTNAVQSIDPETGEVLQTIGGIVYKTEINRIGGVRGGGRRGVGGELRELTARGSRLRDRPRPRARRLAVPHADRGVPHRLDRNGPSDRADQPSHRRAAAPDRPAPDGDRHPLVHRRGERCRLGGPGGDPLSDRSGHERDQSGDPDRGIEWTRRRRGRRVGDRQAERCAHGLRPRDR
jgi:predicted Ser/Thr protein kinase